LLGFAAVAGLGRLLASFGALWTWLTPNALIARMVSQLVSLASLIGGVLLALSILDAMALFGAVAGGAGLVGLAIGFAVRDTIENYIASIMLSLRQPFRAEDHVVINDQEGVIVRLTSRATILMTLDGNHLRIPNADVFKGVILNYSRNPERRFDFTLGVSADDDPIAAMKSALDAIHDLDFLLRDPEPIAFIKEVGDSNIMLAFMAWIDQRTTGFLKARSAAISVAKTALERDGFTLPEPIYRVRLDGENPSRPTVVEAKPPPPDSTLTTRQVSGPEAFDVEPDETAKEQAALERQTSGGEDLLDPEQPIE
ncbi:MAG: mechanosensitive ion channel domain-containing protein, partial [Pseudomonadota bacterium]